MQKVILDLLPGGVAPIVYASQYDDGRSIRFMLTEGGPDNQYSLNSSDVITCNLTKPDGTETVINVANPGAGKTYVDLVNGADDYDQAGAYLGEIVLTKDARVIGSANFVLKVEEDAYGGQITTLTATGNPCTFTTDLADALVSLTADIVCGGGGGTPSTPIPLVGHSELNLANVDDTTAQFWSADKGFDGVVDFNQLATGFVTQTVDDLTVTNNNDGSITVNGTASANGDMNITSYIHFLSTHKYLINGYKKVGSNNGSFSFSGVGTDSGNGNIWNNDLGDIDLLLRFAYSSGDTFNNVVMYPQIYDLTQMFGASIADYIYTLEQGQAGAGVSFFKHFYPDDYYAYNVGETQTLVQMPYTVAFGQTVYGGVLDVTRGKLTVTEGVYTFTGNETIYSLSAERFRIDINNYANDIDNNISPADLPNAKMEVLRLVPKNTIQSNENCFGLSNDGNPTVSLFIRLNSSSTSADVVTAITGTKLSYPLATPIVIDVPSISVFAENGVNNIVSDCGGDVSVTYIKKV